MTNIIAEQPARDAGDKQETVPIKKSAGDPTSRAGKAIFVGAVQIDGRTQIPLSAFAPIIEKTLGREAGPAELSSLASAIGDLARARGYLFASAVVPPQTLQAGVLRIKLDEGAVDEIRVNGTDNAQLRDILNKLVTTVAHKDTVERQLLLAADIPGIAIRSTQFVRENGRGILLVDAVERRRSGYLLVDNNGPDANGPVRARLSYNFNGLVSDGDVLYVQLVDTIAQPRELAFGFARYAMAIGNDGGVVSIFGSLGTTNPGGRLARYDLSGRSWQIGANASYPLLRRQSSSVWASIDFALLSVGERQRSRLIQSDRIATVNVGLNGSGQLGQGRLYTGVGITQGLGVFDATRPGDVLASRRDADGSFTKAYGWLNWLTGVTDKLSLRVSGQAQLTFEPLLSAQEIGYGGPYFGRGYDFSERTGDNGALGLVELRRRFGFGARDRWLQIYTFVDGGVVDNIEDGFGSGSLASAGSGVRAGLGRIELGLEAALPLAGPRFESRDKSPKLNITLGVNF